MTDSQPGQRGPRRSRIAVNGSGVCAVEPDLATVSVGVTLQDRNLAGARASVAEKMQAAIAALGQHGIAKTDISTTRLSIHNFGRHNPGPPEYQVSTMVNAVVRDIAKVDELVNAVLDAVGDGAELNGITFDRLDRSEAATIARKAAFDDAKAKAEHLAELAGRQLGEVLRISEEPFNYGASPRRGGAMESFAASSIPIEAGELQETATVSIAWALESS